MEPTKKIRSFDYADRAVFVSAAVSLLMLALTTGGLIHILFKIDAISHQMVVVPNENRVLLLEIKEELRKNRRDLLSVIVVLDKISIREAGR